MLQPLIRAANGPNNAISLKQTFDRIFVTGNIIYFGVQKAKNGDRGTIVYSAALNRTKFDFTVDEGKEWLNPSREKN